MAKKSRKTKKSATWTLQLTKNNVLTCLLYAVIGLLLIIMKGGSLNVLMTIVGVLFIAVGIVDAIQNKDLVKGLAEIVIGVLVIVFGWLVADIVLLVFGVLLVVKGAAELLQTYKGGLSAILSPLVTIIVGILLIVAKWALMDVMCIIAGIVFLIDAALALFGKKLKK